MSTPLSTYRLQINGKFKFQQVDNIVEYLHELGIHWIYASPVLQAIPGSDHGYDVVNPFEIHPESGTMKDLLNLSTHLKKREMGWLQDIVPNHMAVSTGNVLLMDVLERYNHSPFKPLFDVDWEHPDERLHHKLMLPFLSASTEDALQTKELKLEFNNEDGIVIAHGENLYPVSIATWKLVAERTGLSKEKIIVFDRLEKEAQLTKDLQKWKEQKQQIITAIQQDTELSTLIKNFVLQANEDTSLMTDILSVQHAYFTHWQDSFTMINYRRFFTVNALICLRMEIENNFQVFHQLLLSLYKKKVFQGFRIDHIDGLADPAGYIRQLRKSTDRECYIVAEKILEGEELLPENWHLQGTTGYDFVSIINKLTTDADGYEALRIFYEFLMPDLAKYEELVYRSKKQMLEKYMGGELDNLCRQFSGLSAATGRLPVKETREAVEMFMCCLPVYRIYPDAIPVDASSKKILDECFAKCEERFQHPHPAYLQLKEILTEPATDADQQRKNLDFFKRLMQFTGPLTAKGVEDTTFYIHNHLLSHNEVGDSPALPAMTIDWFHDHMYTRLQQLPISVNAGSTHDTKRGEDARMRINVLSEFASEWKAHVLLWMEINRPYHLPVQTTSAPTINDEYFMYQSLLGSYTDQLSIEEFSTRFKEYVTKSIREAKLHTSWENANTEYEDACMNFIDQLIKPGSKFFADFIPFHQKICAYANVYSSIQSLIKIMAPGIPDIYQGCELLDLSFVDPDNRRPVDFDHRKELLSEIKNKIRLGKTAALQYTVNNRWRGLEKLYTIFIGLQCRMEMPRVFYKGDYMPLYCRTAPFPVVAFCRVYKNEWIIVAAALKLSLLLDEKGNIKKGALHGHKLVIPADAPSEWENVLNGDIIQSDSGFMLNEIFKVTPFVLLKRK
jgi:(1->4)-alpha-D-glucan 1-alpha-D-glucosylmutase